MNHQCIFFIIASTVSLLFGIGAGWMFGTNPPPNKWTPWMWVRQFWLNYLGSFVGWILLWLLIPRISTWIDSGYTNVPGSWEIFLTIAAFIGITGHLPLATVILIQNISKWFEFKASNNNSNGT